MKKQISINLPRRAQKCFLGQELLENEYVSLMTSNHAERRDFCLECWHKHSAHLKKEGSFWHGKIPIKSKTNNSQDVKALSLFREFYAEQRDLKKTYLLALYLQRRKQLMLLTIERKEGRLIFELNETGELFSIQPVHFTDEEALVLLND